MSIDLGASRPTMYSTWLDVIALLTTQVQTGEADFSNQDLFNRVRQISQIENMIVAATARVRSEMAKYGFALTGDPWITPPIERGNSEGSRANIGDGKLIAVNAVSTADMTAVWKIAITTGGARAAAEYTLSSFVEGSQGTGLAMTDDNTSSNGDVIVGDNSFAEGLINWEPADDYFFSLNLAKVEIWAVVTTLAAAFLINSIYTEEAPNESRYGGILFGRAMGWLKKVHEGKIVPIGFTIDYSPIQIPYDITKAGVDITNYADNDVRSYQA